MNDRHDLNHLRYPLFGHQDSAEQDTAGKPENPVDHKADLFEDVPVIYGYSRRQAVEDGVLVAVPEATAAEASFRYPVAMTAEVWGDCVEVPDGVECQDEAGRLWDILWMLSRAILRSSRGTGGSDIRFSVYVRNDNRGPKETALKAVCGPGDAGEPVLTIMYPWQD